MVELFLGMILLISLGCIFLYLNKLMEKLKIPESLGVILIIIAIPITGYLLFYIIGSVFSFISNLNIIGLNKILNITELIIQVVFPVCLLAAFITFIAIALKTLDSLIGIRGKTPKEIYGNIIENDISKVADKILFLQNSGVININEQINKANMENKKTKLSAMVGPFALVALGKNPWANFHVPKDMLIKEENNEIVIYYKKKIYNVNKGKYI